MSRTPRLGKKNLTVSYIRSELAQNRYIGDLFEALQFMMDRYDELRQGLHGVYISQKTVGKYEDLK